MNNDAIALLREAVKQHPELAADTQRYLCQVCMFFCCFQYPVFPE